MAYQELIKNFERIRDYMRQFYVYGLKSREEYEGKSPRSYDNERRRIESWLGEYMSFRQEAGGKNVFLSVDSRRIPRNPLFKAFKAKSFTDRDITLHFYLLDLLAEGAALTTGEIVAGIDRDYLSRFGGAAPVEESTVRKKLKEYEALGLLTSERHGRQVRYRRSEGGPDLDTWAEALAFFSEVDPVGVIGSFLLNRLPRVPDCFRFKHHYILHALDSDILSELLEAIDQRRAVELSLRNLRNGWHYRRTVCPLKIYVSTQSGRQYLLGYHYRGRQMGFFRIDAILQVTLGKKEGHYEKYLEYQAAFDQNLWGVSTGAGHELDHIEMTVRIEDGEDFILRRLEREKRHGRVEVLDAHHCKFTADVYDASEMLPWLRTFLGRITELRCSDQTVVDTFYEDLCRMGRLYGGE